MSNHTKTDNDWKKLLSDESFRVTRQSGTERPFTGKYWNLMKMASINASVVEKVSLNQIPNLMLDAVGQAFLFLLIVIVLMSLKIIHLE